MKEKEIIISDSKCIDRWKNWSVSKRLQNAMNSKKFLLNTDNSINYSIEYYYYLLVAPFFSLCKAFAEPNRMNVNLFLVCTFFSNVKESFLRWKKSETMWIHLTVIKIDFSSVYVVSNALKGHLQLKLRKFANIKVMYIKL